MVQGVVGSDVGGLPTFGAALPERPKDRRLAMISSDFAQHMRNITVLFCPCVSACVSVAEALLFRIDASQRPISRSKLSVATSSTSLVRTQYRPPPYSLMGLQWRPFRHAVVPSRLPVSTLFSLALFEVYD